MALFDSYYWPFYKPHAKINAALLISVIKVSIWQVFIKFPWHGEKPTSATLVTLSSISFHAVFRDTLGFLVKISFTQLLYHSWGCFGCPDCPDKRTSSKNYNLFGGSAVFQPKCNKIENTYKNHHNPLKVTIFSNFGWKTVAQTFKVNLRGSYYFFWHIPKASPEEE